MEMAMVDRSLMVVAMSQGFSSPSHEQIWQTSCKVLLPAMMDERLRRRKDNLSLCINRSLSSSVIRSRLGWRNRLGSWAVSREKRDGKRDTEKLSVMEFIHGQMMSGLGSLRIGALAKMKSRAKGRDRSRVSAVASEEYDGREQSASLKFSYGKMLSELSTWGIGGPAKMYVEVTGPSQMASALRYCKTHSIPWFVVGKGSNCLFDDRGFDGCMILNRIHFFEDIGLGRFRVGSGYPFNMLGVQCSRDGFSGLEFAGGIPGTVGGAVYMNAGADGQETGDVVQSVEIVMSDGIARTLYQEHAELEFGYRTSPFQEMKDLAAIVAVTFQLNPDQHAKNRQRTYLDRRKWTQPITEKTAGCVFRNPGAGCQSAGALIEQAGLKGASVGQARVSEKHANFLINGGGSKSHDMLALIASIKERVRGRTGVELCQEVLFVPYNDHSGVSAQRS